jgi:hypothetical protein
VKQQVEFVTFYRWIKRADGEFATDREGKKLTRVDPMAEELCLVIAEVLIMNPDSVIRVAGAEMSAFVVQEVYGRLTAEHVELVISNFKQMATTIYNKKAYLRTMLYNSVFEREAHYTNEVASEWGGA